MATNKIIEAPAQLSRTSTTPLQTRPTFKKRIIVCCDGTWQDGVVTEECWKHTNILKLSRAIDRVDERSGVPIPQIVYYQSGIGSAHNLYSQYVEGATGSPLIAKVQEAYAFISQNFHPGDEIFLFGFSRGAYTARMIAMFIGAIGVLDRTDMDQFPHIFKTYQQFGKETDPTKIAQLDAELRKWTSDDSRGKIRADSDNDSFSIKCVGVFDTVGSVGLPEELTHLPPSSKSLFGFPNNILGEHIHRAYHALAIDEARVDFDCCKFEQTEKGIQKGQVLKQCWFSGTHSDIGGGWLRHDLSDLTLAWMAANICDMLSIDDKYIASLPNPVAPWGEQPPNDSRVGVFTLANARARTLPTVMDNRTKETIHPSVLRREHPIKINPALLCKLLPLEEALQKKWPTEVKHDKNKSNGAMDMLSVTYAHSSLSSSSTTRVVSVVTDSGSAIIQTKVTTSRTVGNGYIRAYLSRLALLVRQLVLSSG